MKQMKAFLYFAVLTALSLIVCIATFVSLANRDGNYVVMTFAINFPLCLLLCIVYYNVAMRLSHIAPFSRHNVLRVAADWLCATAIGIVLNYAVRCIIGLDGSGSAVTMTFLLWNSLALLGVELFVYHRSVLEKEMLLARLEKEKAAYQFEALKQQINPHFLFNSLNALASLAYQDAEKTNLFAKKLSSVYRYLLLTADKQLVSLREELSFLDSYLYLEHIRFGTAILVTTDVDDALLAKKIVPASLQLLVENALKHNIATEEQPLRIAITATDNTITVENTLQARCDVASNKRGLQNLRSQYAACDSTISIEKTATTFRVALPLL